MACKKLFDCIDSLYEEYVQKWVDVCNLETPTMNKELVDKLGEYFLAYAKQKGWETEVFENPTGNLVCMTMNAQANKAPITFSAHMDTVHPLGSFGTPATKIVGDKIHGPGVTDCKGGAVAAMLAMDALERCGFTDRPLRLLLQSDEEAGSRPINKRSVGYMCEKSKDSLAFFNLEGNVEGTACVQMKGIATYVMKIWGIEAHSSICATAGASAIREAAHKILELEKFKDEDGITCNCGIIAGGTTHNTVPGYCEVRVNFRFATYDQVEEIKKYLAELEKTVYVPGCKTKIEEHGFRPPFELAQRNLDLLDAINNIFEQNGLPRLKPLSKKGGADSAYISSAGIPCLDGLGTLGGLLHSPDEYGVLESLKDAAKRLAVIAYSL